MNNLFWVAALALILNPLLWWLGRLLPGERWQFLAVLPWRKAATTGGESWEGINLTFYGLIIAMAGCGGVAIFWLLSAALGLAPLDLLLLTAVVLAGSVTASKLVALLVEGKKNTFTVAGGAAAGLYLLPTAVWLLDFPRLGLSGAEVIMPLLAALAVAYIVGEGLGRLACLSFGCCYGKPINEAGPLPTRLLAGFPVIYRGKNKKISYASGWEGKAVLPVQLLTTLIYVNVGLVAGYLFMEGRFAAAFAMAALTSLGWRVLAEFLRADYRGGGRGGLGLTAYQWLNLANIIFCLSLLWGLPAAGIGPAVSLAAGLTALWQPEILFFMFLLWLGLFFYFGVSRVTGARLEFYLHREKI